MDSKISSVKHEFWMWMRISLEAITALLKARCIRYEKDKLPASLPAVRINSSISEPMMLWIRLLIFILLFWKKDHCFYRAFALAYVLRNHGLPVILNIGIMNFNVTAAASKGHSWMTLDGKPFWEKNDPHNDYPVYLGSSHNDVQYWYSDSSKLKKQKAQE